MWIFLLVNITGNYTGYAKMIQNSLRTLGVLVAGAKHKEKDVVQIMEFIDRKFNHNYL